MVSQQVDCPALAVDRERGFSGEEPRRQTSESSGDLFVHRRMPSRQEPIELAPSPTRHEVDAYLQNGGHPHEDIDRH